MNLDQLTLEVRPRTAWEAVDLGLLMAKRWWLPMMKIWFLASLPFFIMALCIPAHYFWLSFLLLWWFKPLYERPLLHILSRAVFNELPDTRNTVKLFPALVRTQFFLSLTLRRFSPTRSMDLPVLQLEGLAKASRQARLSVLHREDSAPASWLSFVGILLEIFLAVGMMSFIWSMIPREVEVEWANFFFDQEHAPLLHLKLTLWYVALGLTAPFYVACGFALYLNRRVKLEAWDIDIAFRRIANKRLGTANQMAFLCAGALSLCLLVDSSTHAYANEQPEYLDQPLGDYSDINREQAQESIARVIQQAEFSRTETKRRLSFVEKEEENNWFFEFFKKHFGDFFERLKEFNGFSLIAKLLEILLWSAVLLLVALMVYRYRHWLTAQFVRVSPSGKAHSIPRTLFGMDVTQASLPDDIGNSALHLLQQDDSRAALSLLYRASLFQLIDKGVDIHDGHTEGECVQLMRELLTTQSVDNKHANDKNKAHIQIEYFAELTRHWQKLAYGHQLPDRSVAEDLCRQWNPCWLLTTKLFPSAQKKALAQ